MLAALSLLLSIPVALATQTAASAATTVIAGATGNWGYNGTDIPANGAYLTSPTGISVDGAGNVFFADNNNQIVRKIDTGGYIRWVLGTPQTAKTATNGGLYNPMGVMATYTWRIQRTM
jgi:hypothetical protein